MSDTPAKQRIPQLNKVELIGRLTRDPELKTTQTGRTMCRFDIAVNRSWQNKTTGEWTEETTFVPLVAWAQAAESVQAGAKKGTAVKIEGRLQGREFEDKTGAKRKVLEVNVFKVEILAHATGAGKPKSAPAASTGEEDLEEVPF